MSVHALSSSKTADPVTQAKIDLAAAHRLAVLHGLEEGIDNHFTVTVPGPQELGRVNVCCVTAFLPGGMRLSLAMSTAL